VILLGKDSEAVCVGTFNNVRIVKDSATVVTSGRELVRLMTLLFRFVA